VRALILVDIQNDFVPGGALAVARGDEVVEVANRIQSEFELIVASQDWHPPEHGSFADHHPGGSPGEVIELDGLAQILWPAHCVQGTPGAEFVNTLDLSRVARVFYKGSDPRVDSYSAFFDNGRRRSTGLSDFLKGERVEEVTLLGLATDYCVRFTALDAVREGFRTRVIGSGCRAVDLEPGDGERTLEEMRAAGVEVIRDE
jgi:nicotinamidase/pyrazinamidase